MTTDAGTPRTERQHWAEAVAECVTDEAEALRIVGVYEDGEWQPAMLAIGRENLALKRDLTAAEADLIAATAANKALGSEIGGYAQWARDALDRASKAEAERDALRARVAELESALSGMLAIVSDSKGVAGYHMNGDVAEWDEFEEVGLAEVILAPSSEPQP